MKLWLLGDARRRGQVERTVPLQVDAVISEALEQELAVTTIEPVPS